MPSFSEAFMFARKRNRSKSTGKRFREIVDILRRHDVRSGLTPQKATEVLEELGATFVKLGQIASTHPDILPKEYCDAFGKLRAHVTPMDMDTVREVVERELAHPLEELFSEFDETAVGSASIAQVHRAVLEETGQVVAVKVQRPRVVETVTEDLAILERIVDLYDLVVPVEERLSLKELVDELVRTSSEELDFTIEAGNLERFYENNKGRDKIRSPRCYRKYTTSALLVEDYFDSPRVGDIDSIEWLDEDARERLAYLMAQNYVQQILEDGFFHADPHAGNILITKDEGIEWIDFGMVGTLSPRDKDRLLALMKSLSKGDAYSLQRNLLKVVTPTRAVDHGHLIDICESLIDEFIDVDLERFDMGALLNKLMDMLSGDGYKIDPFLVALARGMVTFEGTVELVSTKLNIMNVIVEYLQDDFDPELLKRRARKFAATTAQSAEAMAGLPARLMDSLDMLQKGQVKVGMDLNVGERFTKEFADAIGNFAFAVLACGMIIGSCILCTTNLPPKIFDIPVIGIFGFVFGTALMLYVSYLILRSRARRRRRK